MGDDDGEGDEYETVSEEDISDEEDQMKDWWLT